MSQKERKPEVELVQELQEAAKKVAVGGQYAHFKHPERYYTVLDIIWDTTTDEPAVVYRAEYGPRLTFSRPLRIWLETVEVGAKVVPRFVRLEF